MISYFNPYRLFPVVAFIACSNCSMTIPRTYVDPSEVTLPHAMKDISCAIKTFQNENSKLDLDTGTLVDQIEVTLQLKASATGVSGLVVNAAPAVPPAIMTSLGASYSDTTTLVGDRGNTLKITFKNVHTAQLNKPGEKAVSDSRPYGYSGSPKFRRAVDNPCDPKSYTTPEAGLQIVPN